MTPFLRFLEDNDNDKKNQTSNKMKRSYDADGLCVFENRFASGLEEYRHALLCYFMTL